MALTAPTHQRRQPERGRHRRCPTRLARAGHALAVAAGRRRVRRLRRSVTALVGLAIVVVLVVVAIFADVAGAPEPDHQRPDAHLRAPELGLIRSGRISSGATC